MSKNRTWAISLTLLAAAALTACGGDDQVDSARNSPATPITPTPAPGPSPSNCTEVGVDAQYACKSGSTEPLYPYQWALKQATSFFKAFSDTADGATDLNVEAVHTIGIKGQGVNVLVLDDGMDIGNEDLAANVNRAMTYNFDDKGSDPTPSNDPGNIGSAHGTNVAGIIGAAQNGKGVMGIAPRATLGGARFLVNTRDIVQAYGGASWSKDAHVINASYGGNPQDPPEYDAGTDSNAAIRAFPKLRGGKGLVMVKAAGNEYGVITDQDDQGNATRRFCPGIGGKLGKERIVSCENPANDTEALEPGVILVGAANAKGFKASYSSAGSVNWVTGLGGESGEVGRFGEGVSGPLPFSADGPRIFSTDLRGCERGYSRRDFSNEPEGFATNEFSIAGTPTNKALNAKCDYSSMNGTSAATPTVTGVVSLMLAANPNLTWRDVRDILRTTAKRIDPDYGMRDSRNLRVNLQNGSFAASGDANLVDGAPTARLDLGWQKNAAGNYYSNWYGFGLVDAAEAVQAARKRTVYMPAPLQLPKFTRAFDDIPALRYGSVQRLGEFAVAGNNKVDAIQLRLSGSICVGSVGIFVKSPAGTISALSVPYNGYYLSGVPEATDYGLGSYAFYGESMAGKWEVYAVSAVPTAACRSFTSKDGGSTVQLSEPLTVEYRLIATM